jgi:hypothetical protein
MALGSVSVSSVESGSGTFSTPERQFLYIGHAGKNAGKTLYIDQSTDLDDVLGVNPSKMKTQISYARLNASANWTCIAMPTSAADVWQPVFEKAMDEGVVCEGVVITDSILTQDDLNYMNIAVENSENEFGRQLFFKGANTAIDSETETWADFIARFTALQNGVYAKGVCLYPSVTPFWMGCVAGRLCDESVSIADSPMRTATGGIVGFTSLPKDKDGVTFNLSHAKALNAARGTVPQTYTDFDGIYCSDCMTLASEGSDFTVLENLRVTNAAKRQVRILALQKIANRELNNTDASIASHEAYFSRPLMEMSRSTVSNGITLPGDVQPPQSGDVTINWTSRTKVRIALLVRPHNVPKGIEAVVGINLTN